MDNNPKKRFFLNHKKWSALMVSIAIHAVFIVLAVTFVAVSVVTKGEVDFKAKDVVRPKMNLRRLQVPINVKKPVQHPKLRKQIVVTPKLTQTPEIRLPEIVGVKGGLGVSGGGPGGAASLGFSIPEIKIFGVQGQGERIFFVLDASNSMMVDEIGGVRSYEIIKSELIRILKELNSTVLFNVAVYEEYSGKRLFPSMVSANSQNIDKAVEWLTPLNRFTADQTSQQQYGAKTTGEGGVGINRDSQVEPLKGNVSHWATPVMEAMNEQADTVFVLTSGWGFLAYKTGESSGWGDSAEARFQKKVGEARKKLEADNARRAAAGNPPRIIPAVNYERNLVQAYFPDEPLPPYDQYQPYDPLDLVKAFLHVRSAESTASRQASLALRKGKKDKLELNVIQFCKVGDSEEQRFIKLTSLLSGEYRQIEGLEAVESYVNGGGG